ncbi:hypothetical protein CCACVL1_08394 [Corchorus capsularis]|uniref:Uncharacterized protein n=1 Tax=Corchorus capsularis TaxID=210143 RepID=A0A1R3J0W3_COCAP|nr:hypothetical protein CCACVL1_08394 [Corchorus capsularis]
MPTPTVEFSSRDTVSDMLNGFIELLQSQCQISYPPTRLASSNELRQDPSLVTIVKIILKFVEDYTPLGTNDSVLLRFWLGVMGNLDMDSFNVPVILNDDLILEQLYTRGAADSWPPQLSLQDCYTQIIDFNATERVVDMDIVGEQRTGSSSPVHQHLQLLYILASI